MTHQSARVYSPTELLASVIGDVARAADSERPQSVSMRAFSAARPRSRFPDAPSAESIHQRFNARASRPLGWSDIIGVACDPTRDAAKTIDAWFRGQPAEHLGPEHIGYALLRALAHPRVTATLTEDLYDDVRADLVAAANRRRAAGLLNELMPTANQINSVMGNWDAALALVGVVRERNPERQTTLPAAAQATGLPIAEAIVVFVCCNGRWPAFTTLERIMADGNARLMARETGKPYRTYVDEAATLLEQRGIPVPDGVRPGRRGRPRGGGELAYVLPANGIPGASTRAGSPRGTYWTRPRCVQALREYLRELRPGQDGRQKHYGMLAVGRHWPAKAALSSYGRFQVLLAEARELEAAGAPDEPLPRRPAAQGNHRKTA